MTRVHLNLLMWFRTALLSLLLPACGTSASTEPAPASQAATPAQVPAERESRAEDEVLEAPAAPTDRALDTMDESEIEAACMAGSTAACDRLGH